MRKQVIEVMLTICIVFLSTLLALSMLNGRISGVMILGALAATYIFVHYWGKSVLRGIVGKVK